MLSSNYRWAYSGCTDLNRCNPSSFLMYTQSTEAIGNILILEYSFFAIPTHLGKQLSERATSPMIFRSKRTLHKNRHPTSAEIP